MRTDLNFFSCMFFNKNRISIPRIYPFLLIIAYSTYCKKTTIITEFLQESTHTNMEFFSLFINEIKKLQSQLQKNLHIG